MPVTAGHAMTTNLDSELAYRASQGHYPSTLEQISARLAELGYELDRAMDCHCASRYMTGPRAGQSYPCITTGIRERDTKLSFANVDARRDANFRQLQDIRREGSLFAVLRGAILSL